MAGRTPVYLYTQSQHDLIMKRIEQIQADQPILIKSHRCLEALAKSIFETYGTRMTCRFIELGPVWWTLRIERGGPDL